MLKKAKTKTLKVRSREFKKKLSEYRRFLKDDYDWDYAYILRLLAYKLKRTRECIAKNNFVLSAPRKAKQIRTVETLLNRVVDHSYENETTKDFHKKYGQMRTIREKIQKGQKFTTVHFKFTKETPRNREKLHREFHKLIRKADRTRERELSRAFDLMKKNIWGWWD
jgi:hypothetical protein